MSFPRAKIVKVLNIISQESRLFGEMANSRSGAKKKKKYKMIPEHLAIPESK